MRKAIWVFGVNISAASRLRETHANHRGGAIIFEGERAVNFYIPRRQINNYSLTEHVDAGMLLHGTKRSAYTLHSTVIGPN
jgi:hypothetical protein